MCRFLILPYESATPTLVGTGCFINSGSLHQIELREAILDHIKYQLLGLLANSI